MGKGKYLIIIAVGLGLISASLVYRYLNTLTPMQQTELVEVVVATRGIDRNAKLSYDMLERRRLPVDNIHPDTVTDMQEVAGRIVTSEIMAGEPLLRTRLLPEGVVPGLSFTIPSDKRAITIAVNEVIGVAGFVKPGDKVDILATFDENQSFTITVLEGVEVLAIAQNMNYSEKPDANVGTSVTLALSPEQAEKLTLAEERGNLRLSLRPPEVSNLASRHGTSIGNLHPSAFSVSGEQGLPRQEVQTRTPQVSQTNNKVVEVNAAKPPSSQEGDNWSVEVIRGVQREVRVVDED